MIAEIGHFALVLALALAAAQVGFGFAGARVGDERLMAAASWAAIAAFGFVAVSFLALTQAFLVSDFSVSLVFENSHSAKPLIYKWTGIWGNHEGSMLLWVSVLALFAALVAAGGRELPSTLRANVLAVQGAVAVAFIAFVLFTSNPFTRLDPAPLEGRDLNPLLQDPGLAIHPPLLYLGYVGFSIAFAFAAAALIEGRIDAVWARYVRPWTLLAWIFLTLGIAMGSYWAYYELGWGGYWFWDPVENASLMPWLAGTALLHSTLVMEKREALKVWTILLAILTFALSLIGTFLVRSGVLTSVHAFATDPERGVFILGILVLAIGGGLGLFALRVGTLKHGGLFAPVSREGALVFNNLFLAAACAAVFIGTLYPLALEAATGAKISVGAPFFDLTAVPLMVPLFVAMPIGQSLAWKRGDLYGAMQRLWLALGLAIAVTLAVLAWTRGGPVLAPLAIGLGVWLIAGSFSEVGARAWRRGMPLATAWARLKGLPRSAFGTALAHAGVGLTVIGIAATAWHGETVATMKVGDRAMVGGYEARLDSLSVRKGTTYTENVAHFTILRGGDDLGSVETTRRRYATRGMSTTEAGLMTRGLGQVYLSLAEINPAGDAEMRLYSKPLVLLIWLGAVVMALGGLLSLLDRRLRIGVPAGARARPLAPAE